MVKLSFYETIFRLFDLNWKEDHDVIEFHVDELEADMYKKIHPQEGIIRYQLVKQIAYYSGPRFRARITW